MFLFVLRVQRPRAVLKLPCARADLAAFLIHFVYVCTYNYSRSLLPRHGVGRAKLGLSRGGGLQTTPCTFSPTPLSQQVGPTRMAGTMSLRLAVLVGACVLIFAIGTTN